jgi:hypothetical protein
MSLHDGRRARAAAAVVATLVLVGCAEPRPIGRSADAGIYFDDFNQADTAELQRSGWKIRSARGHPGIAGAAWGERGVSLVDDPEQPGNRLLRLRAWTAGEAQDTTQVQVCQARKFLEGTYAARVRLRDSPLEGSPGDVVIEASYAVAPLRFDLDPLYSEIDWEYLPNGGWDEPRTRLYAVTWHTARIDPWLAFNEATQDFRSLDGWHVFVTQVQGGQVRYYLDGQPFATHGGRNYPAQPMALDFSVWFSPGGLRPGDRGVRSYAEDVDWVLHARNRVLAPAEVDALVRHLRGAGTQRMDTVPDANPPLESPCDN